MTPTSVISTIWDDPRNVDKLKAMWADDKSGAQIAKAMSASLGARITRNMVMGKAARLKLQRRDPIASRQRQASRARTINGEIPKKGGAGAPGQAKPNHIIHRIEGRLRAERARQEGKLNQRAAPFREGRLPVEDEGVDFTSRIGLLDLNDRTCKWPIGDPLEPGFGFCGAAKDADGKPYCAEHTAKARNPGTRPPTNRLP